MELTPKVVGASVFKDLSHKQVYCSATVFLLYKEYYSVSWLVKVYCNWNKSDFIYYIKKFRILTKYANELFKPQRNKLESDSFIRKILNR